jgi:superfamily II DNA or RNA helicase
MNIESISLLQEQLLLNEERSVPIARNKTENTELILVLKQYRFYKQLCIELYHASVTKEGKLKNPLTIANPLNFVWKSEQPSELKFYSGITRFQNNPTAVRSASDLDALKAVVANPLNLRFFYHNTEFSGNIVAGSVHPILVGSIVQDMCLWVKKNQDIYEISLQVNIHGRSYHLNELKVLYDYFFLIDDTIHLIGNFHSLKLVQFLKKHRDDLTVHESKYQHFHQHILTKLEDKIDIHYSYISPASSEQIEKGGFNNLEERLIYLSDLGTYVIIEPVLRYGNVEIPVLTKRQINAADGRGKLFNVQRNDEAEIKFTALLLRQHPDFEDQLHTDLQYFYLHKDRFLDEDWFLKAFAEWNSQGITVLGFNELKGNKLNKNKATVMIHVTSGIDWFNAEIDVRFGKKKASLKQLEQSVRNKTKFVHLDDGTLGILPAEWIEKFFNYFTIGERLNEALVIPKINFSAVKQMFEEAFLDEKVSQELALYQSKFEHFDTIAAVESPVALNATLRDYQKHGLHWLNFLDDFKFGGCLADDMGLGKSIQIIAFILLLREKSRRNTNLLVVPTSLIFNWKAEIQKFAPSIKVCTIYGADRIKETDRFDEYEVILTSYGTMISDISYLKHYKFNYIFLDESQNIKNVESQRYQAARLLQSRNKIAITGTPIENNVFDLYAQLSFACPGLLGSKQFFRDVYSIPIDKFKERKRALELQKKVAPFILRRTKKEVAVELPDKTEMILHCEMGPEQRKVYEDHEREFRDFISSKTNEEIKKSPMHVLKGLTRLRQICNSPLLLEDEKLYADASSKIDILIEQIEGKASEHKILVFSQFVSMLNLIQKELKHRNISYEYLTGSTRNREAVVGNFQNNPEVRVFLISLKAGGTGLNLTEADYIYLVDPWWNPAVENQAIDRAHRIGQHKNVMAVRLICPGTIEENILKLQESKKELTERLVKADASMLKLLSKTDLLLLLQH